MSSILAAGLTAGLQSGSALAEVYHTEETSEKHLGATEFSPYAGRSYPTKVLWGD